MAEIRYYLDEHVASAIATGLRQHGVDVLTVPEARTIGWADSDQLELARMDGRVLFTHDADYLRLAASGVEHAGIVFSARQASIGDLIRSLHQVVEAISAEEIVGRIEFI